MRRTYTNGYQEKINYWTTQLNGAIAHNDVDAITNAIKSLNYFADRHIRHLNAKNS